MTQLVTHISPRRPAMQAFVDELNRTGVLSDEFKRHLYGLMQNCVTEAFRDGESQAKRG